jgi:deoxyribodipyrimidine photo-lyase
MIQQERIQQLNSRSIGSGDYVIYWMQASQRILDNHALQYSIQKANEYQKHLVVFF